MVTNRDDRNDPLHSGMASGSAPPPEEKRRGLIGWLLGGALALLLLVLLVRGCDDADDQRAVDPATTDAGVTSGARANDAGDPMVPAGAYRTVDFDRYLAGTEPVGRSFALDRVTFASGSAELDDAARAEIANVAGVLRRYPNAQIALTGFADPEGEAAANQALSRRRAEAVRAALSEAGAAAGGVTLAAEGETGAAAIRANRKVEVQVTAR